MMNDLMFHELKTYGRKLAILVSAIAIAIFAWVSFSYNLNAHAATMEGISNQVEGKVTKDIGSKRRGVGDLIDDPTEEAKGALNQAKGKAQQELGTAQNKLDEAGDKLEDSSESFLDSVKDVFN